MPATDRSVSSHFKNSWMSCQNQLDIGRGRLHKVNVYHDGVGVPGCRMGTIDFLCPYLEGNQSTIGTDHSDFRWIIYLADTAGKLG